MKNVAIIQARMGATRFPGKVLEKLLDKPILEWIVSAAQKIPTIDEVVVATSKSKADKAIVDWCQKSDIHVYQGSEEDVLARFYEAATQYKADVVMRLTADCPLLDPWIAGQVLHLVSQGYADYASNIMPPTWPDGLDCEAFTFKALENAHQNALRPSDREHVTSFIRNNQNLFKVLNVPSPIPGLHKHRWTVDSPEDLAFLNKCLSRLKKEYSVFSLLELLNNEKDLIQPPYQRNEGFQASVRIDDIKCNNFKKSQELLERALKSIPLGSQTFSKSYIQYPQYTSPKFLTHGFGSRVWDVDGNEYVDLVSALLPNVLGYADPDINFAIQTQLQKGITLSLATELEMELAEKLCNIIPSAEKVRFGKNGTDVTSAAVRLARAYTGREKILVCGYHGWQDWYIGSTSRNKGIPKAVCDLTTAVPYNDLEKIENLLVKEDVAALIMEPCNNQSPLPGYLQGVRNACDKHGTILVFDEIITGFRFSLGGAQQYFDVTPHLSCFGKAMGNGMPISAIVGRKDIMDEMEDIFFSGTFGGETLSLAAALATIKKIEDMGVIDHLWNIGNLLNSKVQALIDQFDLSHVITLRGYAPWKLIQFGEIPGIEPQMLKTFYMQEMIRRGILVANSHNISFTLSMLEMEKSVAAYQEVLGLLKNHLDSNSLRDAMENPTIKSLFRVR